jgi:DNA replication initiation complex subunit (GINS family)
MYDELRRLQVEEKHSNNITSIKCDTYQKIFAHIDSLKVSLATKWDTQTLRELENCEKVLKEVEMRRAEKIIVYAFNEVYNGFQPVQELTDQEKELYERVKSAITSFKENMAKRECTPAKIAGTVAPILENTSGAATVETGSNGSSDFIKVKVLKGVPKFKATNGTEYGPFSPGDFCTLPTKEADIMIKRNVAEVIT